MNNLFLVILLNLFDFAITTSCKTDILRSILRGYYKDVVSELNGGLMENARLINFYGIGDQKSPLRYKIDFIGPLGYAQCSLHQSIILQLRQAYEINTIRIRFWDTDSRIHHFQVFTSYQDVSEEIKIFEGYAQGLITIIFSDQLVQMIKIYSLGNSLNDNMSIIQIQVFYAL